MIDEYLSFPTNTLYMTDYIGSIPAPAFTICPRPSLKAAFAREWSQNYKKFKDASLSLADFVLQAGRRPIQVFVHDQKEKFAYLESFKPEHVLVLNNTVTNIAIRPEFIQKQNKKDDPCTLDEDYSYMRCIENCFWKRAQTSPRLPCLIPSLLPDGANLTKPECQDKNEEDKQQTYISGTGSNISLWSNCSCVKRCKLIDYHLFLNPVNPCEWRAGQGNATGLASLMFSFPSNRMAHILEMEKVTLLDLLSNIGGIAPASGQKVDLTNVSTVMGETIIPIKDDASYWSERTFAEMQADREYFKCFTLYLDQEIDTGQSTCSNKTFKFDFKAIRDISEDQKKKEVDFFFLKEIQVFVHDQKEKFAYLESFKPEHVLVLNNTVTNIAIRPEFIQKQNKKDDPCTLDEDYSYMRCIENCFWKRAQTSPRLPCLIPSLLPDGANLTKPECQDKNEEDKQQTYISGTGSNISLWSNCSCVKRCKLIDYHLFLNPVNPCEWRAGQGNATGLASLMFSFPSNRMAHILEMEKVREDLEDRL
ncbi:unnamed protein product, partial [Darwinula stevensoni]